MPSCRLKRIRQVNMFRFQYFSLSSKQDMYNTLTFSSSPVSATSNKIDLSKTIMPSFAYNNAKVNLTFLHQKREHPVFFPTKQSKKYSRPSISQHFQSLIVAWLQQNRMARSKEKKNNDNAWASLSLKNEGVWCRVRFVYLL